jgi:hypothetical protein
MKIPKGKVIWTSKGKFTDEVPDHLVPQKMRDKLENKTEKKPEKKNK